MNILAAIAPHPRMNCGLGLEVPTGLKIHFRLRISQLDLAFHLQYE
jgi:hypothetical protein